MKFVERQYDRPLISVIIAGEIWDDELERSLSSVRGQDYTSFQMVLVSSQIHSGLAAGEAGIELVWTGTAAAFNRGLERAEGDLVLFLHAGEEIHSGYLTQMNEALQLFGAGAAQCAAMIVKEGRIEYIQPPLGTGGSYERKLLSAPSFQLHSYLFRREVCAGFHEQSKHDYVRSFLLKTLSQVKTVAKDEYIGAFAHSPSGAGNLDMHHFMKEEALTMKSWRMQTRSLFARLTCTREMSLRYQAYRSELRAGTAEKDESFEQEMGEEKLLPPFVTSILAHAKRSSS